MITKQFKAIKIFENLMIEYGNWEVVLDRYNDKEEELENLISIAEMLIMKLNTDYWIRDYIGMERQDIFDNVLKSLEKYSKEKTKLIRKKYD